MPLDAKAAVRQAKEAFQAGMAAQGSVGLVKMSFINPTMKLARITFEVTPPGFPAIEIPLSLKVSGNWLAELQAQGARYGARIDKGVLKGE